MICNVLSKQSSHLYHLAFWMLPFQAHALSCPSYDEHYFFQQENVAVITAVEARLVEQPTPKVVVTYQTNEVLRGSVPATGTFSFEPNLKPWPTRVDVGHKYIVPFLKTDIEWNACSQAVYRFDECTVYGLKLLSGVELEKDSKCHRSLLRRKAMHLTRPKTNGDSVKILKMSEAELEEYIERLTEAGGT